MKKSIAAAALALGALAVGPTAHAGGVDVGISIGIPGIILGAPAYYPPPPPPPVYYARPPVVVVPQPVYVPGPVYYNGWRGPVYRGHHDRREWKHHWKGDRGPYYGHGWDRR